MNSIWSISVIFNNLNNLFLINKWVKWQKNSILLQNECLYKIPLGITYLVIYIINYTTLNSKHNNVYIKSLLNISFIYLSVIKIKLLT